MPSTKPPLWPSLIERAPGAPPLRVGLVLDRRANWIDSLEAALAQIPGIEVAAFTIALADRPGTPGWLTGRLYSASRKKFDPFGEPGTGETAAPDSLDRVRAADCRIILWLAETRPDIAPRSLAAHGILTLRLGSGRSAIPFWDEADSDAVTTETTLYWHDSSLNFGRAMRTAETPASPGLYVTQTARQPLAAAVRMIAALCAEIRDDAAGFEERARRIEPVSLDSGSPRSYPSNAEMAQFAVRKLARSARIRWSARGRPPRWFVALRPNTGQPAEDLSGFEPLTLPEGVEQMADPFLQDEGPKQYLFFEEIATGQQRGRLACVELLAGGGCSPMSIVLDRPYHLSYPCIVADRGELFLLPETSQANRVELYRFRRFPLEVELVATPLENIALVDTTPVNVDGQWYFFSATTEPFTETLLFSAPRLEGPWKLHPSNPVSSTVRSCRPAGHLFRRAGRLFRPAQDCSVRYGYGIAIKEVTKLTPHEFEERPGGYIAPNWLPGLLGTHTWNENAAFQAIDGLRDSR